MDPAKLKVVELRAELSQRGLDTKGNKAVLVERLRKALEESSNDEKNNEVTPTDSQESEVNHQEVSEKTPEPNKSTPIKSPRASRSSSASRSTPSKVSPKAQPPQKSSPVKSEIVDSQPDSPVIDAKTEASLLEENEPEPENSPHQVVDEPESSKIKESALPVVEEAEDLVSAPEADKLAAETDKILAEADELAAKTDELAVKAAKLAAENTKMPETLETSETNASEAASKLPEVPEGASIKPEETIEEPNTEKTQETEELSENNDFIDDNENSAKNLTEENFEKMETEEEIIKNEPQNDETMESTNENTSTDIKQELPDNKSNLDLKLEENSKIENDHDNQNDHEVNANVNANAINNDNDNDTDVKKEIKQEDDKDSKDQDRKDRKDRKRKRSTSSDRHKSPPPQAKTDDEPEIDYSRVLLSWYDSDLNLVIDKSTFLSATPMHNDGFGYVWAGARASFGYSSGKIYYEVKVKHECSVTLQDEEYPHVLRVGWSTAMTSMQLGEDKLSYGYGGTGKISTGNNFKDYGPKFGLNDVVGCYLDMSGDNVLMNYTLNGKELGQAFSIPKVELDNKPLYPHILTKNCEFSCNFGDEDSWSGTTIEGYLPAGQVDIKERIPGPIRPEKREECEMIMMCGLPGAGKTYWATNYAKEHPEKMYNVLGTNNLIDKMKVIGLPRRRNYHGRWEVLIDKCTRCLNKLLDVAATRRRNYILDQTNVYPSAQRRKMRHFHGFQRKAIVIVPTDEEFKSRTAKREAIEGKDVPDSAILEMKANFGAPVIGESFDAVEWVELDEEEGKKMIAKYNKEGKDAGYSQQQPNKRPRFEKSTESHRDNRDVRSSRDSRDSRDHRDRRNAYPDRNRNSTWRGGNQMGGGWRDRGPRGGGAGGHMRQSSSGSSYGSSPGGWRGGRSGQSGPMHRQNDRRGPSNDRRSGVSDRRSSGAVRQGGWGPMNSNYHNSGSSGGWGGSSQAGGWSGGGSQSSGNWGSGQGGWGAAAQPSNWGSWKGYGSNSNYNQSNYGQQGYGNGNWGGWNQQYYNQYWGQQQPSSGQSNATSGQSSASGGNSSTAASTASTGSTYNSYPQGWQGYTQSYNYSTDGSNASTQQQK